MRTGLALTVFALLVTSARSLAGDHESGLLRMAVTRSTARPALVLGRLLIAPLPILGGLLVSFLGAWLVARSQLDFGPLVEQGYEIMSAEELFGEVRLALFATLPALVALWSFGLLVSACSRTAVGSSRTSMPFTRAVPSKLRSRVASTLIVDDLPAPFGPMKPYTSPRGICRSIPLTAVVRP